ncbi:hypothetical protein J5226_18155 [Lysobacter sp. K5869]|uniref:hypothetical protein n=1 Tax=Lysobacter sp. K5869 TaxID=2820808 RepID=UPI001C063B4F|nr:hypothetical protein [Lysobacter sp. K5869]QWP75521.1 hypothetical protein J5226_18155 [Lysobacter sp. K5869]
MNISPLRFAATAALALALGAPLAAAAAEDEPYRDGAQVRAELVKVLTCQAKRDEFMRVGNALTPLYYDKPAQPALAGWRKAKDANTFVTIFDMPEAITVYGHSTKQVMMVGEGLLAVVDGDVADALSKQLKLKASDEPLARHIRVREISRETLGDGIDTTVTQTVSTITSHPGKTMVGCEYKMVW